MFLPIFCLHFLYSFLIDLLYNVYMSYILNISYTFLRYFLNISCMLHINFACSTCSLLQLNPPPFLFISYVFLTYFLNMSYIFLIYILYISYIFPKYFSFASYQFCLLNTFSVAVGSSPFLINGHQLQINFTKLAPFFDLSLKII